MDAALVLALIIVALILAIIEQVMAPARGRSLICWAVIAIALALLLPALLH